MLYDVKRIGGLVGNKIESYEDYTKITFSLVPTNLHQAYGSSFKGSQGIWGSSGYVRVYMYTYKGLNDMESRYTGVPWYMQGLG